MGTGIGIWRNYREMPVSEWDDYLIHQTVDTIERAGINDYHFAERLIFCSRNAEGTLHLMAGAGTFPNAGLTDGFVCVRYKNIQRNIRISRHLHNDRTRTEMGPLSFKVLEPLKRWGVYLDENDYGIGCSLEFQGRVAPWSFPVTRREQRITEPGRAGLAHFDQPGYFTGVIKFEDQQFNADGFFCIRDRTWGIRRPAWYRMAGFYFWTQAQFSSFSLCLYYFDRGENRYGGAAAILNDDGSVIPIVDIRHRIHFMPADRDYTEVEYVLVDASGKERHLSAIPISPQSYMAGGGYDNRMGLDMGPFHIDGEEWIVSSPFGIESPLFGMNQRDAEFQLDGEPGAGLIECSFSRNPNWQYEPTI